ncbi:MAG: hypothetical protein HRU03_08895 [Nanoarchaeales archaeon]|nr:hypothetical protein [Nanoarchaeales archaeon]
MQKLINLLVTQIKDKNQIKDLEDKLIIEKINKYFLTNGDIRKKLEKEFLKKENKIIKSKLFKEILKIIRKEIGIIYGSFLTSDFDKREKYLNQANTLEETQSMLKLHKSTRERVDYYNEIYNKIFEWKKPKKIADLCCGLNPISISLMKEILNYTPKYFASDINPKDMEFMQLFFNKFKIKGTAKSYDLTKLEIIENKQFKDCDMVFLFKALDSLEFIKKNCTKELILKIPSKNIVVSFPTKSLVSKKEFKIEKRNWFIKFIEENNFKYERFEIENELFFLIEK